jgi:hypothetical protein
MKNPIGAFLFMVAIPLLCSCNGGDGSPDSGFGDGGLAKDGGDAGLSQAGSIATFVLAAEKRELPVPFDFLTRDDPTAPTGLRVSLGARCSKPFDLGIDFMSEKYRETIETDDGWSSIAPLLVQVGRRYDPSTLKRADDFTGADSPIWLFEIPAKDEAVKPIKVSVDFVDTLATDQSKLRYLSIRPLFPLVPSTRHALLVRRSLTAIPDLPTVADADFAAVRDGTGMTADQAKAAGLIKPVVDILTGPANGIPKPDISLVTVFTTMSITDDYETIVGLMDSGAIPAPVMNLDPDGKGKPDINTKPGIEGVAMKISGTFASPEFTDADGAFVYGSDGKPVVQRYEQLRFVLLLPTKGKQPFNIAVYQHGISDVKESAFHMCRPLFAQGIAVIAIDAVTHGTRTNDPEGAGFQFLNITLPATTRDNFRQTTVDHVQLTRLVKTLGAMDYYPADTSGSPAGDGKPDLDVSEIGYDSHSLGGIIGGNTLGVARHIGAGLLVNGGGTLMDFVEWFITDRLPNLKDMPELPLFSVAVGNILDKADPCNLARYVTSAPRPMTGRTKQVLLIESINDDTVPNITTENLARALGLPLVAPYATEIWGLSQVQSPAEKLGLFQYDPADHNMVSNYSDTPIGRNGARAREQMAHFLRSYFDTGTGEIINPPSQ